MTRPDKIRPPTHSSLQPSDPKLRAEAEDDLPDQARAPDPNRNAAIVGAIDATALEQSTTPFAGVGIHPAMLPPIPPGAAFDPRQAVELRREMNEPNRAYGLPYRPNEAERLLANYTKALAEYREDYARTRSEAKRIPFLEAKEAMIKAGLMQGDV